MDVTLTGTVVGVYEPRDAGGSVYVTIEQVEVVGVGSTPLAEVQTLSLPVAAYLPRGEIANSGDQLALRGLLSVRVGRDNRPRYILLARSSRLLSSGSRSRDPVGLP